MKRVEARSDSKLAVACRRHADVRVERWKRRRSTPLLLGLSERLEAFDLIYIGGDTSKQTHLSLVH